MRIILIWNYSSSSIIRLATYTQMCIRDSCKDYVVEGDELKSIAAGTGGLNYPLLLKKIKEHKPYVHCTLENTVPENAVATREFMEKLYSEV